MNAARPAPAASDGFAVSAPAASTNASRASPNRRCSIAVHPSCARASGARRGVCAAPATLNAIRSATAAIANLVTCPGLRETTIGSVADDRETSERSLELQSDAGGELRELETLVHVERAPVAVAEIDVGLTRDDADSQHCLRHRPR